MIQLTCATSDDFTVKVLSTDRADFLINKIEYIEPIEIKVRQDIRVGEYVTFDLKISPISALELTPDGLQLVNDSDSPGQDYIYMVKDGQLGWHPFPREYIDIIALSEDKPDVTGYLADLIVGGDGVQTVVEQVDQNEYILKVGLRYDDHVFESFEGKLRLKSDNTGVDDIYYGTYYDEDDIHWWKFPDYARKRVNEQDRRRDYLDYKIRTSSSIIKEISEIGPGYYVINLYLNYDDRVLSFDQKLTLIGDDEEVGPYKYYGTNERGELGWWDIPRPEDKFVAVDEQDKPDYLINKIVAGSNVQIVKSGDKLTIRATIDDDKVKVSHLDAKSDYLQNKIKAGFGIDSYLEDHGPYTVLVFKVKPEYLRHDRRVKVSATDAAAGALIDKIRAESPVVLSHMGVSGEYRYLQMFVQVCDSIGVDVDGSLQLVGDVDAVCGEYYYGTNDEGIKGFYPLPDYRLVVVNDEDIMPDFLSSKIEPGAGVDADILNKGYDEKFRIRLKTAKSITVVGPTVTLVNDLSVVPPFHYYGFDEDGRRQWLPWDRFYLLLVNEFDPVPNYAITKIDSNVFNVRLYGNAVDFTLVESRYHIDTSSNVLKLKNDRATFSHPLDNNWLYTGQGWVTYHDYGVYKIAFSNELDNPDLWDYLGSKLVSYWTGIQNNVIRIGCRSVTTDTRASVLDFRLMISGDSLSKTVDRQHHIYYPTLTLTNDYVDPDKCETGTGIYFYGRVNNRLGWYPLDKTLEDLYPNLIFVWQNVEPDYSFRGIVSIYDISSLENRWIFGIGIESRDKYWGTPYAITYTGLFMPERNVVFGTLVTDRYAQGLIIGYKSYFTERDAESARYDTLDIEYDLKIMKICKPIRSDVEQTLDRYSIPYTTESKPPNFTLFFEGLRQLRQRLEPTIIPMYFKRVDINFPSFRGYVINFGELDFNAVFTSNVAGSIIVMGGVGYFINPQTGVAGLMPFISKVNLDVGTISMTAVYGLPSTFDDIPFLGTRAIVDDGSCFYVAINTRVYLEEVESEFYGSYVALLDVNDLSLHNVFFLDKFFILGGVYSTPYIYFVGYFNYPVDIVDGNYIYRKVGALIRIAEGFTQPADIYLIDLESFDFILTSIAEHVGRLFITGVIVYPDKEINKRDNMFIEPFFDMRNHTKSVMMVVDKTDYTIVESITIGDENNIGSVLTSVQAGVSEIFFGGSIIYDGIHRPILMKTRGSVNDVKVAYCPHLYRYGIYTGLSENMDEMYVYGVVSESDYQVFDRHIAASPDDCQCYYDPCSWYYEDPERRVGLEVECPEETEDFDYCYSVLVNKTKEGQYVKIKVVRNTDREEESYKIVYYIDAEKVICS